jgi:DNA polymerase-4
VGGGVVLAASYEAKAFGVSGGMSGKKARELCPHIKFVGGHFGEYKRLGDQSINVLKDFTPLVERISIDEAFADVSGSVHLFGTPGDMAREVRRRVQEEVGLPISVGVARTKHLAKIASQVAKPDGLVVVNPDTELAFLHDLPVGLMWGVGPVTKQRLADQGVFTIGELSEMPGRSLERLLGKAVGAKLGALAWNRDTRDVQTTRRSRSMGAQSALGKQRATPELIVTTMRYLADRVATRLRAKQRAAKTVTVRVRFEDMRQVTRSITLSAGISSTVILADIATDLANVALAENPEERIISLLAISVSQISDDAVLQLELPLDLDGAERRPGSQKGAQRWVLDKKMDEVREKFGRESVAYGAREKSSMPDEFRELVEKND